MLVFGAVQRRLSPHSVFRNNASLAFQEVIGLTEQHDLISDSKSASFDEPERDASNGLVIHGLLGAGRNWRSISQDLATQAAKKSNKNWQMTLIDLRNHGASASKSAFQPPHDLQSTAQDLINFYTQEGRNWPTMVTGHSLGGKVALEYLRLLQHHPNLHTKLPKEVWILDSQLGPVSNTLPSSLKINQLFETIHSIPLPIPSRKWLYSHIRNDHGMSLEMAHWLGSNLEGHPNGPLQWMFNVQGAAEMYDSYKRVDCWEAARKPPRQTNVNIVRAGNSDRWNEELIAELKHNTRSSKTKIHVLENCGHWLHADNPGGLVDLMLPSLTSL